MTSRVPASPEQTVTQRCATHTSPQLQDFVVQDVPRVSPLVHQVQLRQHTNRPNTWEKRFVVPEQLRPNSNNKGRVRVIVNDGEGMRSSGALCLPNSASSSGRTRHTEVSISDKFIFPPQFYYLLHAHNIQGCDIRSVKYTTIIVQYHP